MELGKRKNAYRQGLISYDEGNDDFERRYINMPKAGAEDDADPEDRIEDELEKERESKIRRKASWKYSSRPFSSEPDPKGFLDASQIPEYSEYSDASYAEDRGDYLVSSRKVVAFPKIFQRP